MMTYKFCQRYAFRKETLTAADSPMALKLILSPSKTDLGDSTKNKLAKP